MTYLHTAAVVPRLRRPALIARRGGWCVHARFLLRVTRNLCTRLRMVWKSTSWTAMIEQWWLKLGDFEILGEGQFERRMAVVRTRVRVCDRRRNWKSAQSRCTGFDAMICGQEGSSMCLCARLHVRTKCGSMLCRRVEALRLR